MNPFITTARRINWLGVQALRDAEAFPFARNTYLIRAHRYFREARHFLSQARKA